jgi:hypothetical protein
MSILPRNLESISPLKVGTAPTRVLVLSEPCIRYTDWGYIPVLHVQVEKSGIDYLLAISARSLAKELRNMHEKSGQFTGLRFTLRRVSEEKAAAYEVCQV